MNGTVNFTTIDADWNDVGDITGDNYTVADAHITDCEIVSVVGNPNNVTLGQLSAVKFKVEDGISRNKLINARCVAEGYDVNSAPLLFEPYGIEAYYRYTGAGGEVGFQHMMSEEFWTTHTTYLYEFHCECLNDSGHACYDETNGTNVGFKTCHAKIPFTTNNFDEREVKGADATNFFIYLGIMGLTFLLFIGMHTNINADKNKKDKGTAYFYGILGAGVQFILAGVILSGFKPIDSSVTFMFDINYYLSLISIVLGIFSAFYGFSIGDDRETQSEAEEGF